MSVDAMCVDAMCVDAMSVNAMSVDAMCVDAMTVDGARACSVDGGGLATQLRKPGQALPQSRANISNSGVIGSNQSFVDVIRNILISRLQFK